MDKRIFKLIRGKNGNDNYLKLVKEIKGKSENKKFNNKVVE